MRAPGSLGRVRQAMKQHRLLILSLALAVAASVSTGAAANGVDFFVDALQPGPHALMYAGRIRDTSGKPIPNVRVYVEIARLGISLEVHADSEGRYRTHDLRKAMQMIGEELNPSEITLFVKRAHYHQIAPKTARLPRRSEGTFHIDFVMARD